MFELLGVSQGPVVETVGRISIDFVMSTNGQECDRFLAFELDELKHDSQIVAGTTGPEPVEIALELMGLQRRVKSIPLERS